MSGTVLAEAGWHMEAVLEGPVPGVRIKQPEVEGPGVDARVFAIGCAPGATPGCSEPTLRLMGELFF